MIPHSRITTGSTQNHSVITQSTHKDFNPKLILTQGKLKGNLVVTQRYSNDPSMIIQRLFNDNPIFPIPQGLRKNYSRISRELLKGTETLTEVLRTTNAHSRIIKQSRKENSNKPLLKDNKKSTKYHSMITQSSSKVHASNYSIIITH